MQIYLLKNLECKEFFCVKGCTGGDFIRCAADCAGNVVACVNHKRGFVAASSLGHGGKVGGISFKQQPIERDFGYCIGDMAILEGCHTVEPEIEVAVTSDLINICAVPEKL